MYFPVWFTRYSTRDWDKEMIILCLISRDDRFRLDEGLTNKGRMSFVFGTLGENGTTQKNYRIENATATSGTSF